MLPSAADLRDVDDERWTAVIATLKPSHRSAVSDLKSASSLAALLKDLLAVVDRPNLCSFHAFHAPRPSEHCGWMYCRDALPVLRCRIELEECDQFRVEVSSKGCTAPTDDVSYIR